MLSLLGLKALNEANYLFSCLASPLSLLVDHPVLDCLLAVDPESEIGLPSLVGQCPH